MYQWGLLWAEYLDPRSNNGEKTEENYIMLSILIYILHQVMLG